MEYFPESWQLCCQQIPFYLLDGLFIHVRKIEEFSRDGFIGGQVER
jgi:hypothetical protein